MIVSGVTCLSEGNMNVWAKGMAIHQILNNDNNITQNRKCQPHDGTREKLWASPVIKFHPLETTNVQKLQDSMEIHQRTVEIFESGLKRTTDISELSSIVNCWRAVCEWYRNYFKSEPE